MNICCYCGADGSGDDFWFHGQSWLCDKCNEWGITRSELVPTITEVFEEQYHRIGKDGKRYWGRLGGGIVFTNGKKVLLLKRAEGSDHAGSWGIPGGRAKEKEAPLDTAKRESKEECGTNEGSRFEHFHSQDGAHHFHTYLFSIDSPFDVTLSKEHTDSAWVPLDEVMNMNLHPKLKESWPAYLRAIKKRYPHPSFSEWASSKAPIVRS